jgi:hypothetical protein
VVGIAQPLFEVKLEVGPADRVRVCQVSLSPSKSLKLFAYLFHLVGVSLLIETLLPWFSRQSKVIYLRLADPVENLV